MTALSYRAINLEGTTLNDSEITSVHEPVMVAELCEMLNRRPDSVVIDATVGGGGHAAAMLAVLPESVTLVGLDADAAAVARARRRLAPFANRVSVVHASFRNLAEVVASYTGKVTNIVFDLGLSSDQLADESRGFSFHSRGPLDMRWDVSADSTTAGEVVNSFSEEELAKIIYELGGERRARAIARAIVTRRRQWPFATAAELAEVVARAAAVTGRGRRLHPATRTFQALRIYVNDELNALAGALPQARQALIPGGRLFVIAYHSLEDRVAKDFMRAAARRGEVVLLTPKPLRPSSREVAVNPRSRSARLRVVEVVGDV